MTLSRCFLSSITKTTRLTDTTMSTVSMMESPMGSVVPIQVMPTTGNGLLKVGHRYCIPIRINLIILQKVKCEENS